NARTTPARAVKMRIRLRMLCFMSDLLNVELGESRALSVFLIGRQIRAASWITERQPIYSTSSCREPSARTSTAPHDPRCPRRVISPRSLRKPQASAEQDSFLALGITGGFDPEVVSEDAAEAWVRECGGAVSNQRQID